MRLRSRNGPLALVQHFHVAAERKTPQRPLGLIRTATTREDRPSESHREPQHLNVEESRCQVVAVLVKDDEQAERDEKRDNRGDHAHAFTSTGNLMGWLDTLTRLP